ncbi:organic cation transporter protein-like isoform X2 [Stegodyphus dumicola]|uniref:organic cation transporter protein-like isoform X2 n=1 Tax=Stegodyphus dumicola TaxID=202533 RepID=UPI0015ACF339|nr:organic cation transporter protein-like isoform X2 [Stegodyphus dumicola]
MTADIETDPLPSNRTVSKKSDILDVVGGNGPWQRRIFLIILLFVIPDATHNFSISFLAPNLDHWCARPSGVNISVEEWKRIALPPNDYHCSKYKDINLTLLEEDLNVTRSNELVKCDAWEYDETFYTSTLLSQWNLVCDKEWLVSMLKSVFMGGVMVSVVLFGYIADKLLPESPRWLLSQGRVEEAQETLSKAAKANGIEPSDIDTTLRKIMSKASEAHESGEASGNFLDLLRTPGLWQMTLNVYFLWFVNVFVYYGLSYNTNELAGDPFVNFALSGAVEFPAYVLSIIAIRSLGRRNPLAVALIIGGVACLLCYLMPENPWWFGVTVSMIGKFCISCAFGIILVFTAEIFPTVVRNIGLGSASMVGRVGSILAPFIRELGHATHPVVPQIVYGVLAVTSGMLVLLLPETNNCVIPDTIKEAANASRKKLRPTKHQNDHSVTIKVPNGDADKSYEEEKMTAVTSLPNPAAKPQENSKKLVDVKEEEIHFEGPATTVREPDDDPDPSEVAESGEVETTQASSPEVSEDVNVETENTQSAENVPDTPENDSKNEFVMDYY